MKPTPHDIIESQREEIEQLKLEIRDLKDELEAVNDERYQLIEEQKELLVDREILKNRLRKLLEANPNKLQLHYKPTDA